MPGTGTPRARIGRLLAIAFGAAFVFYLFVQPGNRIDEAEHLHVAWLMTAGRLQPIHDFFEHHTPLFWHLLGLIFRAGFDGPEAIYPARALVIVCAAVWCWALTTLVRRWSDERGARPPLPGSFAVAAFAGIVLFSQDLVVVRPETLALALLGGAFVCWTGSSRPLLRAGCSGALLALSALASPRFVLLTPALLVASPSGRPVFPGWGRFIAGTAASVVVLALFVAFLCPWPDLLFDLRFSSLLQHVGRAPALDIRFLVASVCVAAVLGSLVAVLGAPPRVGLLSWLAVGALAWGICLVTAGTYLYPQAFAPALAWLSLFVAWLEAAPKAEMASERRTLSHLVLANWALLAAILLWDAGASPLNVFTITESRRLVLANIPPGERVLMITAYHPIAVRDASYWGSMLLDEPPGRGCETANLYDASHPDASVRLPRCDFPLDLQRGRPYAVTRTLYLAAPPEQFEIVRNEMAGGWSVTDRLDTAPVLSFAGNVLFRR
jgi:hypothetical protein